MGFYSFYKIVKDVIRTIFGKRFLRIALIILIIMLVLGSLSNCFASSDFTYDDYTIKLPDFVNDFEYYFVAFQDIAKSGNRYFTSFIVSDSELSITDSSYFYSDTGFYYIATSRESTVVDNSVVLDYSDISLSDNFYKEPGSYPYIYINSYLDPSQKFHCFSSHDIYNNSGDLIFAATGSSNKPTYRNPTIANTDDELSSGNFDSVLINNGDYNYDGNYFYFHVAKVEELPSGSGVPYYVDEKVFSLDKNSSYFLQDDGFYGYSIPVEKIFAFENNKKYIFVLSSSSGSISTLTEDVIFDKKEFTVSEKPIEEVINDNQDITNDKLDEQTNAIKNQTNVIQNQTNVIQNQTNVIQDTSDKLFSDEYDESQINISTEPSDNIDSSSITNFVTTLLQNIQNIATGNWNSVETVSIPLGFVDEDIQFRSDLISSHIPQALKIIINLFWMYLFGMYIFKYTSKLIDWLKSGDILNNKEIGANEVITSSML